MAAWNGEAGGAAPTEGSGSGFLTGCRSGKSSLKNPPEGWRSRENRTRVTAPTAPSLHAHRGLQPRGTVCTLPTIVDLENSVLFLFKIKGGLRNGGYKGVTYSMRSFPGGFLGSGDPSSIPGSGRFPWRRKWQPIQVFFHGQELGGLQPVRLQSWIRLSH